MLASHERGIEWGSSADLDVAIRSAACGLIGRGGLAAGPALRA